MKPRIFFLDNLRTFLIFLVVLLHSAMTYQHGFDSFWIVVDPAKCNQLALVNMYLDLFIMFTMFFISGYFIPNSLKNKSSLGFVKSKLKRILLPWGIAVFTLIPAYKAIFLFSRGLPQEEWFSYFHLFLRAGTDFSIFSNNPSQNWLWFLPVLFLFQLIYLALSKTSLLSKKNSIKTGVVLVFVVGVLYSLIISAAGLRGWTHSALLDFQNERILIYFVSFLLGSLCNKLEVFNTPITNKKQHIIITTSLLISATVFTLVALNIFYNIIDPSRNQYIITEQVDKIIYYLTSMLCMLGFMYILIVVFRNYFNKSIVLMNHLNQYSYQVYIIHMIVLGVFALILLPFQLPGLVKFILLTSLTYTFSNLLIHGYKRIFKKKIALQTAGLVLLITVLFAYIEIDSNKNNISTKEKSTTTVEKLSAPADGIHEAALKGDLETIKIYISNGSDLNEKDQMGGNSPLGIAAVFGRTDVALALIEAGAELNFQDKQGSTPLHSAAFFCRTEIVLSLLQHGADKNIRNNAGSTALESVTPPFEAVKGIYDYFGNTFGPLGMVLDYERLERTRPLIAGMLQ